MKSLLALLLAAACPLAMANPDYKNIPPSLQKALHGTPLKSAAFETGVLRLTMDKPEVSELVYATFIFHNICREQWVNAQQFSQLGLKRVELLNRDGSQGFAFENRGDVCEQMGQLGKNYRSFIDQYTVKCTAGVCPGRP
jgi:hypothetical protein